MTRRTKVSSDSSVTEPPKPKNRRKIPYPIPTTHQDTTNEETEEASQSDEQNDNDPDEQHTTYTDSSEPRNHFYDSESDPLTEFTPEGNSFDDETAASLNSVSNSSTAAYLNIAPLPIFRGGTNECPVTHLSRFAKVCRANNALSESMMVRIFPVTLDNEAAVWYDLNIEPYPSLTWEEIKSSFLDFYHRTELVEQFRFELRTIKMGDTESIQGYYLRLQWILKRWPDHGISEGLLKGIFIDGLREDFQDWIVPQRPGSLEEALRLALTWEQVQSIRASRKKKVKCGFCEGEHEEKMCEIRERMKRLWVESCCGGEKEVKENKEVGLSRKELVITGAGNGGGSGRQLGEEEESNKGEGGKKKGQCQCWKHQCWKKNLERNNSLLKNLERNNSLLDRSSAAAE
ncbi:hypothetical protein NE237_000840 [Protea cynaroides]|uniref:Retrotransposon gag domain-containing protein n=1 Tax=Protea cynaroides TaxID=273540 RepID=A0A9Q0QXV7_9MAGN|nr:hypothetical protein NE237_000840 [Protea cynaroides]